MTPIEPANETPPSGATVSFILVGVSVVLLIAVLLAIGVGAIDIFGQAGPRLVCFIGEEVVFNQSVDKAERVGETITVTIGGQSTTVTPPEGGACYIAE